MRQTAQSRMYKLGYIANNFDILDWVSLFGYTANPTDKYIVETGVPGVDYVSDTGRIAFAANVDAPITMGMLSPQVLVLPAKDIVNVKAKIIWDNTTGVGEKVGWFMYVQHSPIGDTLWGAVGDGFKQAASSPADVDYTNTLAPGLDYYWAFPRSQYAIGYGTAYANTLAMTDMHLLRYDTPTTLKLDPDYALRSTSEYIDGDYMLLTMYIYRMAGWSPLLAPFLQDGVYDADGCGSPDSDTLAGAASLLGVLLEFD